MSSGQRRSRESQLATLGSKGDSGTAKVTAQLKETTYSFSMDNEEVRLLLTMMMR
jgi:hypothetical protein